MSIELIKSVLVVNVEIRIRFIVEMTELCQ